MNRNEIINFEFYYDKLIDYRKKLNLSQEELAEKLNVSRQSIYAWENGKSRPDIENIIKLCQVLEVPVDKLSNCLKENMDNNKKYINKKIIFKSVLIIVFFIIFLFLLVSIKKGVILNKINNRLISLENIDNYYYKETTFKSSGNRGYDFNNTEVFFKDNILKMIHRDSKNASIIWIDYINNEGYVFDTQSKLGNKLDLENSLFPNKNGLRQIASTIVSKNKMVNYMYSFNPFFKISVDNNYYLMSNKRKINNYTALVEEKIDKENGSTISKVEYGSDGVNIFTDYKIEINNVTDEDVNMPSLIEYGIN